MTLEELKLMWKPPQRNIIRQYYDEIIAPGVMLGVIFMFAGHTPELVITRLPHLAKGERSCKQGCSR